MMFLLVVLAVVSVHRIWHYEDVFAPVRSSLGARLLLDPVLSLLWITPLVCSLLLLPEAARVPILVILAVYAPLRGMVFLHEYLHPKAACSPCEMRRREAEALSAKLRSYSKRVIFLGSDLKQANWMAQKHRDWIVIYLGQGTPPAKTEKNVIYKQFSQDMVRDVQDLIFAGGNASIVLWNVSRTDVWNPLITILGHMQGVTWVHVGSGFSSLPAHHKAILPGEPLDRLL